MLPISTSSVRVGKPLILILVIQRKGGKMEIQHVQGDKGLKVQKEGKGLLPLERTSFFAPTLALDPAGKIRVVILLSRDLAVEAAAK